MDAASPGVADPSQCGAQELSRAFAARRLSPVDAVDALLARITRLEPKLQAFVEVYGAEARLAAEAADKAIRSGHPVSPLHGVPIALKDLIDLEGRITSGGSASLRQRRSQVTATIAKRMLAQGMIVLGKTHTVEFAMGGWGTNQHLGTPWNPWDPAIARTPGGSSSGSGVAVAARLAPWAIGTDTGGSVRLPASFCGLTGLKVTVGRISTHGIIPLSSTLDTPGPMARSVEDAALLYNVVQGPDPLDLTTRGIAPDDPLPTLRRGVRGLRLARMPAVEREGVAPDMLAAYDKSIDLLANLGAEIVDIALPFRFADLVAAQAISQAESYFFNGHLAEDAAAPLDDAVRKRVLSGATVSANDYLKTKRLQQDLKQKLYAAMDGIDALLTPTTETAAIPLTEVDQDQVPSRFTRFGNLLELCALALPNGFTAAGLPLSLQIACRGYEEAMALRIGHAYQQATEWHLRRPPVD
ncbi:aspartyl-tRNA(Asn)/glutamyl-tRNA(Gln) amidotransferase subunit A [Rhizobiales bacterium GAS191]|nr:aspartyl-tRNA(Asn)/glutamyl-tRNA(Gln) amidotransferase subunit A [Rhizobiales bacterium GAS191]